MAELATLLAAIVAADPAGERHHLRDPACTISEGGDGPVQVALVADDLGHLSGQLASLAAGRSPGAKGGVFERTADGAPAPQVAFLFPGQGSQRVDMLADLFVAFPPCTPTCGRGGGGRPTSTRPGPSPRPGATPRPPPPHRHAWPSRPWA